MLLIAIGWIYVVLMVALVEATAPGGSLLGAGFTLLLYGVLPLAIVGYLFFAPARRRTRRAAAAHAAASAAGIGLDPDQRGHAPGAPLAPEREEP